MNVHLVYTEAPALLNHLWHSLHCTEPVWSSTGLLLSSLHLCLFKSPGRLKFLPHTHTAYHSFCRHFTSCWDLGWYLLLPTATMYCQPSSASEPSTTALTLHSTSLFTYWLSPLSSTLVTSLIILLSESSSTLNAQHILLYTCSSSLPCLLMLTQTLTSSSSPLPSFLGITIPILTHSNSPQVPLHHIPPSPSRPSTRLHLGQPSKQAPFRETVTRHPS